MNFKTKKKDQCGFEFLAQWNGLELRNVVNHYGHAWRSAESKVQLEISLFVMD